MTKPLGIRLNNPGLLEITGDKWEGMADEQLHDRFITFKSAAYGIRAMARTHITYQNKYNIHTLRGMISRRAPSSENPIENYIKYVSDKSGISPDDEIDARDYKTAFEITRAIIAFENGQQPYTDAQINRGLLLAGIEPDTATYKSRTVVGSRVAISSTAVNASLDIIKQQLEPFSDAVPNLRYILFGVTLLGLAIMAYALFDNRRKGFLPW